MGKRLLDYDPLTRQETWHHYDPHTDTTIIEEVQDCAPILELNKSLRNYGQGGAKGLNEYSKQGIKNNMWHVAKIPNDVILKWKVEYNVDIFNKHQTKEIMKLLERPEWEYLRTGTGKLV